MEAKKEYSNGELTVVWKPAKCQHSGICVKTLPNVYRPKEKPWIKAENATTAELKSQIEKCPSGALTYYMNQEKTVEDYELIDNETDMQYEFRIEGHIAKIEYKKKPDTIYLIHTEVPEALQGRGIATKLIVKTLEDIKNKGLQLVPICPLVKAYIKRHPEWNEIVRVSKAQ